MDVWTEATVTYYLNFIYFMYISLHLSFVSYLYLEKEQTVQVRWRKPLRGLGKKNSVLSHLKEKKDSILSHK